MQNIICFLFNHRYRLKRKITSRIREIKCTRCKKEFAMHDDMQCVIPLDDELIEFGDDIIALKKIRESIK